ncbi:MAG: ABC transporter permease subunit [Thermoplasmatota archaeon]
MDGRVIYGIAKKEFLDNWRNKWIIAMAAIFLVLTLVVSYAGSSLGGGSGWQDIDDTIAGMMSIVTFLIPIIGLMLGYAAIVGEKESGSLQLLLSYPVHRYEVLVGKFLGLSSVLAFASLIGFGVSGAVIGLSISGMQWGEYGIFIVASFLIGFAYIALSLCFSAVLQKRSTALGLSVLLWFLFAIIWNTILLVLLVVTENIDLSPGSEFVAPTWYHVGALINPVTAYQTLVAVNIGPVSANIAGELPSFYSTPVALTVLLAWIAVPLLVAFVIFRRKDI